VPHEVFISYATQDEVAAKAICATLERNGKRCWIAPRDVLPGVDYGEAIIDAIQESRLMVVVFSSHANVSPHVRREVEAATRRSIALLPFRIEDVPLSRSLEYFLTTSQWLDALTPPLEPHLENLNTTLTLLLKRTARDPISDQSTQSVDVEHPPTPHLDHDATHRGRYRTALSAGAALATVLMGATAASLAMRTWYRPPSPVGNAPTLSAIATPDARRVVAPLPNPAALSTRAATRAAPENIAKPPRPTAGTIG
jgi:hypothetical protein